MPVRPFFSLFASLRPTTRSRQFQLLRSRVVLRIVATLLLGALVVDCESGSSGPAANDDGTGCSGPIDPGGGGHYWTRVAPVGRPFAVAGRPGRAIAVGRAGLIVSLTPARERVNSNVDVDLNAVWVGDNAAVAVGAGGAAVRFNGSDWEAIPTGVTAPLFGVWGASGDDVFAVGADSTILHFDGSAWTQTNVPQGNQLNSIWGAAPNDVFAVGVYGYPYKPAVFHYDGINWSSMGAVNASSALSDVWGSSATDVFAVGGGSIVHYDGQSWLAMAVPPTWALNSVWGTSSNNVFAVGTNGAALHYNGQSWNAITISWDDGLTRYLRDIGGTDDHNVFVVGYTDYEYYNNLATVMHYDGMTWEEAPLFDDPGLNAVWTQSWSDAYAVGELGTIIRINQSTPSRMTSPATEDLFSIWGSQPDSLIAVGSAGTILCYDGSKWNKMSSGTTVTLRDVWSMPGESFFAVGDGGTVLQYSDGQWTPMTSGVSKDLNAIWGASSQNVYAVGDGGTVIQYDGVQWKPLQTITGRDLYGVWVSPEGSAVVVGSVATMIVRTTSWQEVPVPPVGDLLAVWGNTVNDVHAMARSSLLHYDGKGITQLDPSGLTGSLRGMEGGSGHSPLAVSDDGSIYSYY